MAKESKKLALLRILEILQKYSDVDNIFTHEMIAKKLETLYGIEIERKSIASNLRLLLEAGYDIEITRKGCYLREREFTEGELYHLIDGVLFSSQISTSYARDLINKIGALGGENFVNKLKVYSVVGSVYHSQAPEYFNALEVLKTAITERKKVRFNYAHYGLDAKLHENPGDKVTFSPYTIVAVRNHYYVVGNDERYPDIRNLRIDKILNIELTDERIKPITDTNEKEIRIGDYVASHPYMFSGKASMVKIRILKDKMDHVVDFFKNNFKVEKVEEEYAVISVYSNENDIFYWALQFGEICEIIRPISLREKIKKCIDDMAKKYS
ncbi:MAG: WYL domain-containing protein [Clostridia bacterium]|nr:WYL domain-containing protein [Clostridia bacterium]